MNEIEETLGDFVEGQKALLESFWLWYVDQHAVDPDYYTLSMTPELWDEEFRIWCDLEAKR